jgi:hypothetical protein
MIIDEEDGWLLSDNANDNDALDPAVIDATENGVTCQWIYLGVVYADAANTDDPDDMASMTIVQSFHLDGSVGNWAQSDILTFDEEFFALQTVGNASAADLPGDGVELPGHGLDD